MTAQEIGSYIRFGFTPIIFVINNNGYSIERAINGEKQTYNDISMLWDHQKMLEFFGARKENDIQSRSAACKSVEELEAVLGDGSFAAAKCIQVSCLFHCILAPRDRMLIWIRCVRYSLINLTIRGD
jgi:pyruvate decarboxylase